MLVLPGTAMLLMLLFPGITLRGTRRGLLLWYQFFLPAVFPFMILSGLMTRRLKRGGKLFAVIGGFLNGYPNGAKIAADLQKKGLLSPKTAPFYAAFCNMSGPMFLASYANLTKEMPLLYLTSVLLLYLCCVLSPGNDTMPVHQTNCLQNPVKDNPKNKNSSINLDSKVQNTPACFDSKVKKNPVCFDSNAKKDPVSFDPESKKIHASYDLNGNKTTDSLMTDQSGTGDFLLECTGIMVKAGIYIMYFSILIELLAAVSYMIPQLKYVIPFLEMTTGIACIQDFGFPCPRLRLYYRLFLCTTGGMCTIFQTGEVIRGMDLTIWKYILLKLLQGLVICGVCFMFNTICGHGV